MHGRVNPRPASAFPLVASASSPIPVLSSHPVYLHHLPAYSLTLPALPALLHHLPTHSLKLLAHPNLICHLPSQPTLLCHLPAYSLTLPSYHALFHHLPAPRQLPSQEINPSNLIRPFKIFPQRILIF